MNLLGAPTSLGLKPYDHDGRARGTDTAPRVLREQGVVRRLGARDLGDVVASGYRDFIRQPGKIRNEDLVVAHAQDLARTIEAASGFTLVLGGDCSILLGNLLGHRRRHGEVGLVFIDGHGDFNTPDISETGGSAGMDLALATGRGASPLAHLDGADRLVRDEDVVLVGVRDGFYPELDRLARAASADDALAHIGDRDFFIHLDVDALDPAFMPFVDEPVPNGLTPDGLAALLGGLVHHPRALGMEVTIYDPFQDREGRGASLLVDILARAFRR